MGAGAAEGVDEAPNTFEDPAGAPPNRLFCGLALESAEPPPPKSPPEAGAADAALLFPNSPPDAGAAVEPPPNKPVPAGLAEK